MEVAAELAPCVGGQVTETGITAVLALKVLYLFMFWCLVRGFFARTSFTTTLAGTHGPLHCEHDPSVAHAAAIVAPDAAAATAVVSLLP